MVAVVTRLPEDHALTAEGVESDLLRCCAVSVQDDGGVEHVVCRVFSGIVQDGSEVCKAVADPLGECLQGVSVQRVGSLEDGGAAAALLGLVDDEDAVLCLISEPCCRVRVGCILPTEHGGRNARVDTADLVELAAGTVQHG